MVGVVHGRAWGSGLISLANHGDGVGMGPDNRASPIPKRRRSGLHPRQLLIFVVHPRASSLPRARVGGVAPTYGVLLPIAAAGTAFQGAWTWASWSPLGTERAEQKEGLVGKQGTAKINRGG